MTSQTISLWGFVVIAIILLGFAALVLWALVRNEDSLLGLVLEPRLPNDPPDSQKASLSRFQFLIFTFVIAGLFLLLSIEAGTFVNVPENVLYLLGISGGSYVTSKWVGKESVPPKRQPKTTDTPSSDAQPADTQTPSAGQQPTNTQTAPPARQARGRRRSTGRSRPPPGPQGGGAA